MVDRSAMERYTNAVESIRDAFVALDEAPDFRFTPQVTCKMHGK